MMVSSLLIALILFTTFSRLLTNYFRIIPKIFNLADIFITLIFLFILVIHFAHTHNKLKETTTLKLLLAFNLLCLVAAIANHSYIYLDPFISQLLMLNEGPLLFLAIMNLPIAPGETNRYFRTLLWLVALEIGIGVIQIPLYYSSRGGDWITGTFPGNHEQYGGFIFIGLLYLTSKSREAFGRYILPIIGILCLIILIDNKASWLGILVSLFFVYCMMFMKKNLLGALIPGIALASVLTVFGYIIILGSSGTLYKYSDLYSVAEEGNLGNVGKIRAYYDIIESVIDRPYTAIIGSGLGTFYSRASSVYFPSSTWGKYSDSDGGIAMPGNVTRAAEVRDSWSNSMGGVIDTVNNMPYFAKYAQGDPIDFVGARGLDSPWSTYAGLLGENGLLGTGIYLAIYFHILARLISLRKNLLDRGYLFNILIVVSGFMVYLLTNSVYNNWLETGRMTTLLFGTTAMLLRAHEQPHRIPARCNPGGL
jgi:hypothetical protein